MLVELGLVEQRYQAVLEVLNDGATVTDVARRYGVARQTVHEWLRRYAADGLGRVGGSVRRGRCRVRIRWRRWSRRGSWRCAGSIRGGGRARSGLGSGVRGSCRCRGGRRSIGAWSATGWSRRRPGSGSGPTTGGGNGRRAMELWQMDIVGGVRLVDGSEAKIVSGIDDHSRFVVSAQVVARATARPMCDALALAMRTHGVPEQILTDNGKVFTARFGPGPGPVLFDRICRENGIRTSLTAPRSPTTTGKVERWHKTLRREFLDGKVFASIDDAQAQLDGWVRHYNHERPHQSLGRRAAVDRFKLAAPDRGRGRRASTPSPSTTAAGDDPTACRAPRARSASPPRTYKAGVWLAGQAVEVVCDGGLVQLSPPRCAHRHPRPPTPSRQAGRRPASAAAGSRPSRRRRRPPASVTRKVDSSGNVCFAGTNYRVGNDLPAPPGPSRHRRRHRRDLHRQRAHPHATPSATTAPANTAPSPTPAADPAASTPPDRFDLSGRYRGQMSGGYRVCNFQTLRVGTRWGSWMRASSRRRRGSRQHRRTKAQVIDLGRRVV